MKLLQIKANVQQNYIRITLNLLIFNPVTSMHPKAANLLGNSLVCLW